MIIHHRDAEAQRKPDTTQTLRLLVCCLSLCLCASVVMNAQRPPTNLGPITTTTQDMVGTAGPPTLLPPPGQCRAYFNTQTGALGWINSSGSSCGPDVTGSCPNCIVTSGGNATIAGQFSANSLQTTGPGPWQVTSPFGPLSCGGIGLATLGNGVGGIPSFCANGGPITKVAYQDGSGNVVQNALSASALAALPAQCSGNYATGIQANGTANCDSSTIVLIPQQTCSSLVGVPGFAMICADSGGDIQVNINNAGFGSRLGYSNLLQSGDTLEQRNGTNSQTFNLYSNYSAAGANYQRIGLSFDPTADSSNGMFIFASTFNGSPGTACSGSNCGIGFKIGSGVKWGIDSSGRWVPFGTDGTQNIGHSGNRIQDLWIKQALRSGSSGNTDLAGQCTLGTNCVITFTDTYTSAPICVASDTTAIAATRVVVSTTTLTITGTGTDVLDYICIGRN